MPSICSSYFSNIFLSFNTLINFIILINLKNLNVLVNEVSELVYDGLLLKKSIIISKGIEENRSTQNQNFLYSLKIRILSITKSPLS